MPGTAEVQLATINEFIEGWKCKDPKRWIDNWTDDCTNTILPFSLKHPGWSKEEVRDVQLPRLFGNMLNWKLNVHEVIHDPIKSKAAIYAMSEADTPYGDDDFKWSNEYAAFLTLNEDGTKIKKVEEMVDTAFFQEWAKQGVAYRAKKAKETENAAAGNDQAPAQTATVGA